ncbi:RICIN domain-containing protein [Kibdelosporangium phytohabitans]|uniref:Ricin B lectin domain-containing protein n=1 Tax=Kibdelosporangium phytohabitans TaxID=860235 RepID=A0A0N7F2J7_9PSEU|nr:RICIN domain-containing protein [Kibdelosporangium phytohabitans]ALG06023.1 hypothetical protein AOZ06_02995 [Kibdelosporangium phytohabitans]MBE1465907.1 hypothetical protein [Kibdelosporangium phytohabitans]
MRLRSVLAVLALALGLVTAAGGTASAVVFFQIRAQHSDKCIEVDGGVGAVQDGARVVQRTCGDNKQSNQLWKLIDAGNGVYRVSALHSGKCLDVSGAGTGDGVPIQQWACLGDNQTNQRWRIEWAVDGGYYRFFPVHVYSRKCLDIAGSSTADGTPVLQWECIGYQQANQKYRLISS